MTLARIYQNHPLSLHTEIALDSNASHHLSRVLRARVGEDIIVFNGEKGEYLAAIRSITKKSVSIFIKEYINKNSESSLELYLAQGISRGEKMDYTIQKAVELGVKKIFPLITERCNVKLDDERREKRLHHWQSIIISACEQSGRTELPHLMPPSSLNDFLKTASADWKFILSPQANHSLSHFKIEKNAQVILLIGPEGGFSEHEITLAANHQFSPLKLGPRVLRTETAAVSALSILQFFAGDLDMR